MEKSNNRMMIEGDSDSPIESISSSITAEKGTIQFIISYCF